MPSVCCGSNVWTHIPASAYGKFALSEFKNDGYQVHTMIIVGEAPDRNAMELTVAL